jgi:hypothetical protein
VDANLRKKESRGSFWRRSKNIFFGQDVRGKVKEAKEDAFKEDMKRKR